ncbi:acyl carrier protein [Cellulosilyticum ruminicola]|uniref:acyl carrier protein n=1 Tax=Cellulosilyticum ruminicola TaxID=425254 RepID=UPI0006D268C2|nr:phosphopantetheine-binding protein [Cellulosilyticum ruminicola]
MENYEQARESIRNFIIGNMDVFDEDITLADDDNIFEKGFVTSIFAMRLLDFIEDEFKIEVADEDINLVNFSSVQQMVKLVEKSEG